MTRLRNIFCTGWGKTTENDRRFNRKLHVFILLELKTEIHPTLILIQRYLQKKLTRVVHGSTGYNDRKLNYYPANVANMVSS
jgi:hypothetical protein